MTSGNSAFPHRLLALLMLIGACWSAPAAPEASDAGWDVEQLMHSLAQVQSAKGTFVERKYLSILSQPLEFSGTLVYMAPAGPEKKGRLEKNTLLPKPESLILEQDQLTIENKTKNRRRTVVLQDYPVIWAFVESIRSTLAGDLPTLRRFYQVSLMGTPEQWRLKLLPREPAIQAVVSEIRISGSRQAVGEIEIIEAEGDRSVMTITEDR